MPFENFSDFSEPSSAVSPMKKWPHRFDGFAMDQGKGPNLKGTLQDTHTQTLGWYIYLQIYHKNETNVGKYMAYILGYRVNLI